MMRSFVYCALTVFLFNLCDCQFAGFNYHGIQTIGAKTTRRLHVWVVSLSTSLPPSLAQAIRCSREEPIWLGTDFKRITPPVLPFPACMSNDLDCLRRGLRTFFFLMNSGYVGMKPIDPAYINSVAVSLPEQQISLLVRKVNATGAVWTRLAERKFNLLYGNSGAIFFSDLHVTGEIVVNIADRFNPVVTTITIDIDNAESNITYPWFNRRGIDNEDYIILGTERVAVRNTRTPTYFLLPYNEDSRIIDEILQNKPHILEHVSNEIVGAIMHMVVDNFRHFAQITPVKHFYNYY